jgi:hypothetical protein
MKKEEWKTGFKLLRLRNGRLQSFFDGLHLSFNYSTRHITKIPNGYGPMILFATAKEAKEYEHQWYPDWRLYRCKYVESRSPGCYQPYMDGSDYPPSNSVYADKVRLTRRIK